VILLVLLQHGKGADMGAAFGSGASGSLFGATGSANFLSRLTAAMAAVFFVSTLALAFVSNEGQSTGSVMEGVSTPASSVPAVPGSTPDSSVPPASTVPPAPGGSGAAPSSGQMGVPSGVPSGGGNPPAAGSGAADQIPK
jgi:preprotein translocase subunit SecG